MAATSILHLARSLHISATKDAQRPERRMLLKLCSSLNLKLLILGDFYLMQGLSAAIRPEQKCWETCIWELQLEWVTPPGPVF